jgi:hypothetical protein
VKKTTRLDGGYSSLGPGERFRLVIAAYARDDERERELLFRSCPRATFSMRDPAFQDRLELACELSVGIVSTLQANRQRRNAVDATTFAARRYFALAADAVEYEGFLVTGRVDRRFRRAIRRESGRIRRALRHLNKAIAVEGADTAHAFAAFCRHELEIDAEDLVGVFMPEFAELLREYLAEDPDPDRTSALEAEMVEVWRGRLGEAANP